MSQRSPVSAELTWSHAPGECEYRVAVRNEDTGEKRIIYQGMEATCHLPSDVRRSADQWSYRVEGKALDRGEERFHNLIRFTGIERVGDDFVTQAADLIVEAPRKGAAAYRLLVRDKASGDLVVDFARPEPRFLLPPGRLHDAQGFEWQISPLIKGRWKRGAWGPVTRDMVTRALARSEQAIQVEPVERAPIKAPSLPVPSYQPPRATTDQAPASGFLALVDFTIEPSLAPTIDPVRLLDDQWGRPGAPGAGERALEVLENRGLSALVFIDVLATLALEPARLARIVADLSERGHRVEPLVRGEPWRFFLTGFDGKAMDLAALTRHAVDAYAAAAGRAPLALRFDPAHDAEACVRATADLGVPALFMDETRLFGLPQWMWGRIHPFQATEGVVLVPITRALSLPAHTGDRTLSHALSAADPYLVSEMQALLRPLAASPAPVLLAINSTRLIARRKVRDPKQAETWNAALKTDHLAWQGAGLGRSTRGFPIAAGPDYVAIELLERATEALLASDAVALSPVQNLSEDGLRAWAAPRAFETVAQIRRGGAVARASVVRRYDEAYRIALRSSAGAEQ